MSKKNELKKMVICGDLSKAFIDMINEMSKDRGYDIAVSTTEEGSDLTTKTTKTEPKAKAKVEYPKPYTVDGKNVTIGREDGEYLPGKVFNAVKYCIKQNGGKWDSGNKVWVFKSKDAVAKFEKAWKDGNK